MAWLTVVLTASLSRSTLSLPLVSPTSDEQHPNTLTAPRAGDRLGPPAEPSASLPVAHSVHKRHSTPLTEPQGVAHLQPPTKPQDVTFAGDTKEETPENADNKPLLENEYHTGQRYRSGQEADRMKAYIHPDAETLQTIDAEGTNPSLSRERPEEKDFHETWSLSARGDASKKNVQVDPHLLMTKMNDKASESAPDTAYSAQKLDREDSDQPRQNEVKNQAADNSHTFRGVPHKHAGDGLGSNSLELSGSREIPSVLNKASTDIDNNVQNSPEEFKPEIESVAESLLASSSLETEEHNHQLSLSVPFDNDNKHPSTFIDVTAHLASHTQDNDHSPTQPDSQSPALHNDQAVNLDNINNKQSASSVYNIPAESVAGGVQDNTELTPEFVNKVSPVQQNNPIDSSPDAGRSTDVIAGVHDENVQSQEAGVQYSAAEATASALAQNNPQANSPDEDVPADAPGNIPQGNWITESEAASTFIAGPHSEDAHLTAAKYAAQDPQNKAYPPLGQAAKEIIAGVYNENVRSQQTGVQYSAAGAIASALAQNNPQANSPDEDVPADTHLNSPEGSWIQESIRDSAFITGPHNEEAHLTYKHYAAPDKQNVAPSSLEQAIRPDVESKASSFTTDRKTPSIALSNPNLGQTDLDSSATEALSQREENSQGSKYAAPNPAATSVAQDNLPTEAAQNAEGPNKKPLLQADTDQKNDIITGVQNENVRSQQTGVQYSAAEAMARALPQNNPQANSPDEVPPSLDQAVRPDVESKASSFTTDRKTPSTALSNPNLGQTDLDNSATEALSQREENSQGSKYAAPKPAATSVAQENLPTEAGSPNKKPLLHANTDQKNENTDKGRHRTKSRKVFANAFLGQGNAEPSPQQQHRLAKGHGDVSDSYSGGQAVPHTAGRASEFQTAGINAEQPNESLRPYGISSSGAGIISSGAEARPHTNSLPSESQVSVSDAYQTFSRLRTPSYAGSTHKENLQRPRTNSLASDSHSKFSSKSLNSLAAKRYNSLGSKGRNSLAAKSRNSLALKSHTLHGNPERREKRFGHQGAVSDSGRSFEATGQEGVRQGPVNLRSRRPLPVRERP